MILAVRYHVPMYAEVDTEAGTVTRVIVEDEHTSPPDVAGGAFDPETGEIADQETTARAVRIAEEQEWPAWEFGR